MTPAQLPQSKVDRQTFLKNVRQSGLVDDDRLRSAMEQVPETDRARVVARALVDQRILTKFQAERLLAGVTDGFCMGQYRILEELGRGGMGRVFKAEHLTMGRLVGLKVLNPNLVKTETARQLFEREVKAAAKLTHPNIVTAYDANQLEDRWYLVMEFVDGPNLHDLVKAQGPLPVERAVEYIRQAACGLDYAHSLGMVHRDIKPANLLVQQNQSKAVASVEIVKILDFGLARLSGSDGAEANPQADSINNGKQTVMGTPDFISPEQAKNLHSTDGRSDLYSLGCTFYYLLTGQVVYPGGSTMEKLVRHTTDPAPSVQALRPDVPDDVARVLAMLLAKQPEDRFQSAKELFEVLNAMTAQACGVTIETQLVNDHTQEINLSHPVEDRVDDPWAGIDHDEDEDEYEPTDGTLPEQNIHTYVEDKKPSRIILRQQEGLGAWFWLMPVLILGVAGGVFFTLRALLK